MLSRMHQLRLELKNQEALQLADVAVRAYPHSVRLLIARSDILKELGFMKQSGADLDAALKMAPQNEEALRKRCRSLDMTGHLCEALAAYDVILRKNPKDANFWSYRGEANKRLKRYADAAADFSQAIKNQPDCNDMGTWLFEVGNCRLLVGDQQGALEAFDQLVKKFPDLSTGYWGRARVFEKMGRIKDAERDRNSAKKFDMEIAPHDLF